MTALPEPLKPRQVSSLQSLTAQSNETQEQMDLIHPANITPDHQDLGAHGPVLSTIPSSLPGGVNPSDLEPNETTTSACMGWEDASIGTNRISEQLRSAIDQMEEELSAPPTSGLNPPRTPISSSARDGDDNLRKDETGRREHWGSLIDPIDQAEKGSRAPNPSPTFGHPFSMSTQYEHTPNSDVGSSVSKADSSSTFAGIIRDLKCVSGSHNHSKLPEAGQIKDLLTRFISLLRGYSSLGAIKNEKMFNHYTRGLDRVHAASDDIQSTLRNLFINMESSNQTEQFQLLVEQDTDILVSKARHVKDNLEDLISDWIYKKGGHSSEHGPPLSRFKSSWHINDQSASTPPTHFPSATQSIPDYNSTLFSTGTLHQCRSTNEAINQRGIRRDLDIPSTCLQGDDFDNITITPEKTPEQRNLDGSIPLSRIRTLNKLKDHVEAGRNLVRADIRILDSKRRWIKEGNIYPDLLGTNEEMSHKDQTRKIRFREVPEEPVFKSYSRPSTPTTSYPSKGYSPTLQHYLQFSEDLSAPLHPSWCQCTECYDQTLRIPFYHQEYENRWNPATSQNNVDYPTDQSIEEPENSDNEEPHPTNRGLKTPDPLNCSKTWQSLNAPTGHVEEIIGDLFSSQDSLAHCVGADLAMGAGIAIDFKIKFGNEEALRSQGVGPGGVAILKFPNRFIYYLITKSFSHEKPVYRTLEASLLCMRDHASTTGITRISIPRIGCGLDELNWSIVRQMLISIFKPTNITITVYSRTGTIGEPQTRPNQVLKSPPIPDPSWPAWDRPKHEEPLISLEGDHELQIIPRTVIPGDDTIETYPEIDLNTPEPLHYALSGDTITERPRGSIHHKSTHTPHQCMEQKCWNQGPGPSLSSGRHCNPEPNLQQNLHLDPKHFSQEASRIPPGGGLPSRLVPRTSRLYPHNPHYPIPSFRARPYNDSQIPEYANLAFSSNSEQPGRSQAQTAPQTFRYGIYQDQSPPRDHVPDNEQHRLHQLPPHPRRIFSNTSLTPQGNIGQGTCRRNNGVYVPGRGEGAPPPRYPFQSLHEEPRPELGWHLPLHSNNLYPDQSLIPPRYSPQEAAGQNYLSDSDDDFANQDNYRKESRPHERYSHIQSIHGSSQRDIDALSTMLKELRRSNKQMRGELEDIGDPSARNSHQLRDHLRRRDKTTQFANEHNKKLIRLDSQLKKSLRKWGNQVHPSLQSSCAETLEEAQLLDMEVMEASNSTARLARQKGLTITTTGAGTNGLLTYPNFSEDSEIHLYEWLTKMSENFEILNTDLGLRATIMKDHLEGNAKLIINESMKTEEEVREALINKFGDMHSIYLELNCQHDRVGPIPNFNSRDPARLKEFVNKTSRHLNLIKRKELMLKYDNPGKAYETTLKSVGHFKILKALLPLEEGALIHGTESSDPKNAYTEIKKVFEKLHIRSGYINEQLLNTTKHSFSKKNIPYTDMEKPKGKRHDQSDLVLYSTASHATCRICDIQKAEGIGKNHHSNHLYNKGGTTHPSNCPNYLRLGMKGRRDFLGRHKICQYCLRDTDTKHKLPFDQCREGMLKPKPTAYKCLAPNCPQRKENCEIHKTQNQSKLENRAKILKEENNIEFIFIGVGENSTPSKNPASDHTRPYLETSGTALMGVIQERLTSKPEVMDTTPVEGTVTPCINTTEVLTDKHKFNSQSETLSVGGSNNQPVSSTEIIYAIKPSPLETFLEAQAGQAINNKTFTLGEVLAVIKEVVIKNNLFDPANDTIVLCSEKLEAVLNMKALHIKQVKSQILPQMTRLPNQLEIIKECKPSSSPKICDKDKFFIPPKLANIILPAEKGKFQPLKKLKFMEILKYTTMYIKEAECKLFDSRNKDVAIIKDDPLGEALGLQAFHRFQLVNILKRLLIPCSSSPLTSLAIHTPINETRPNPQPCTSWPSSFQLYSTIAMKSILKPPPNNRLRDLKSKSMPSDEAHNKPSDPMIVSATPKEIYNKENIQKTAMENHAIECFLKNENPRNTPFTSHLTSKVILDEGIGHTPSTLLWKGPTSNLDELITSEGFSIEVPPVEKTTLLFMYLKGRTRPLATLFDTGCTTSLVRKDVLGTELMAAEIKRAETTLIGFGGQTRPLDKFAFYLNDLNGDFIKMEGHAVDTIVNVKKQDTSMALMNLKLDSTKNSWTNPGSNKLSNAIIQSAEVYPSYGGEIDVVIGMNYIKYFPDLVFRSTSDLGLFRLKLQSHSPQYKYCLGGNNPWEEGTHPGNPRGTLNDTSTSFRQLWQNSTLFTTINEKSPSPFDSIWTPTSSNKWPTSSLTTLPPKTREGFPFPCPQGELQYPEFPSPFLNTKHPIKISLKALRLPNDSCSMLNPRKPQSTGKVKSLKRLIKNDLSLNVQKTNSSTNRRWNNAAPVPPPETRPIFVGTYQVREPANAWPSMGQLLRKGNRIPSLNFFQMLLKGKSRALLTLFSPQHCGILVRDDVLSKELDFKQITKDTVNIVLPLANGDTSSVNAHKMSNILDITISNRNDAIMAMSSPRYDQSSRPYRTQPHLDGQIDLLIGFTAREYHPRPILNRKTGVKLFKSCLKQHDPSYRYCAEGLYNLRGYLKPQIEPPKPPHSLAQSLSPKEKRSLHCPSPPTSPAQPPNEGHCMIISEPSTDIKTERLLGSSPTEDTPHTPQATHQQTLIAKPQRYP